MVENGKPNSYESMAIPELPAYLSNMPLYSLKLWPKLNQRFLQNARRLESTSVPCLHLTRAWLSSLSVRGSMRIIIICQHVLQRLHPVEPADLAS